MAFASAFALSIISFWKPGIPTVPTTKRQNDNDIAVPWKRHWKNDDQPPKHRRLRFQVFKQPPTPKAHMAAWLSQKVFSAHFRCSQAALGHAKVPHFGIFTWVQRPHLLSFSQPRSVEDENWTLFGRTNLFASFSANHLFEAPPVWHINYLHRVRQKDIRYHWFGSLHFEGFSKRCFPGLFYQVTIISSFCQETFTHCDVVVAVLLKWLWFQTTPFKWVMWVSALPLVALTLVCTKTQGKYKTCCINCKVWQTRKENSVDCLWQKRVHHAKPLHVKSSQGFWYQHKNIPEPKSCPAETHGSRRIEQHRRLAKCNGFTLLLVLAGYSTRLLTQGFLTKLRARMPT